MLKGLGLNGSEQAWHRLGAGVYPIKGEKNFVRPRNTPERVRANCLRKYYADKDGIGFKLKTKEFHRKYLHTVPECEPRQWEDWEVEFLEKTRSFPARVVAFALRRGIKAVQHKRQKEKQCQSKTKMKQGSSKVNR